YPRLVADLPVCRWSAFAGLPGIRELAEDHIGATKLAGKRWARARCARRVWQEAGTCDGDGFAIPIQLRGFRDSDRRASWRGSVGDGGDGILRRVSEPLPVRLR